MHQRPLSCPRQPWVLQSLLICAFCLNRSICMRVNSSLPFHHVDSSLSIYLALLHRRNKRNLCSHYCSLHVLLFFLGIMAFYVVLIICSKLTFVVPYVLYLSYFRCFNHVLSSFKQNYNVIHTKFRSFLRLISLVAYMLIRTSCHRYITSSI